MAGLRRVGSYLVGAEQQAAANQVAHAGRRGEIGILVQIILFRFAFAQAHGNAIEELAQSRYLCSPLCCVGPRCRPRPASTAAVERSVRSALRADPTTTAAGVAGRTAGSVGLALSGDHAADEGR